jgi:hypothetical protein
MKSFLAKYWFSAALIGLLILAIPGFVLVTMNFFGEGASVNRWLESKYQLSYRTPLPPWAEVLLLLLPLAILILYFLKLKRKALSVPSTFLWRKSIEDLHVNSLLQWLRQNVLLLLQLLTLLGLGYALLGFRFHGRIGEGKYYILMIDNSASMGATDVAPSRLEWAKAEALKEIDGCADSDVGMVLVFNSSAEIRQSFTNNRDLLRRAVKEVVQTQRVTRIEEALALADSLANPIRSAENMGAQAPNTEPGKERTFVAPEGTPTSVHLFSDGRFPDLSEATVASLNSRLLGNESVLGNLNVHYHMAGKAGPENVDNVALVTVNAVKDEADPTRLAVFVRAQNYRPRPVSTRVQVEVLVKGALKNVYEKPLQITARKVAGAGEGGPEEAARPDVPGESSAEFQIPDVDERADTVIHARLVDLGDQFPLDDEAWLVIGSARKAKVLIVGPHDDVLQKFFDAPEVRVVAEVTYLGPEDLARDLYLKPARNGLVDLVIFDRCAPRTEAEMPLANTFFVGAPPPPWKRENLPQIDGPHITGWRSNHPILRDLRALYTIEVDQTFQLTDLPARTPALIEARKITKDKNTETILLVALARQSFTDLVLTFPIMTNNLEWNTTWPLQPSFPLFLRNILYTLGNLSESAADESVQPGQLKVLRPEGIVKHLDVLGPDKSRHSLTHVETRADFAFGATDQVGIYRYGVPGADARSFAVNLLDADESNIEPRPTIAFGSEKVIAGKERSQPRDTWKWFALLALALLMLEWYIYNRRIYV